MPSQLKHRLIGTIVLVALLVIILPDLFDGKKDPIKEQFSAIPFAPEPADEKPLMIDLNKSVVGAQKGQTQAVSASTEQPTQSNQSASQETAAKALVTSTTASDSKTSGQVKPIVAETPANTFKGTGWIIQLATLKSASSTQELIDKLRKAGYQAHSYPNHPVDGQLNRIFVGPELSKKDIEAQLTQLKKLTGLQGLVRKFDPLDH
ncbi:SPOR domain-containing protein [Celerinatantimonas yamalensis]|uniref:SPOR domain-containing protein n=1 Tax=Celerinatantimonas yamalensis TaxID=559956 RepID=A0ABW9G3V0_9GAMM